MFKMSRTMQDQLKALQKSCRLVEKKMSQEKAPTGSNGTQCRNAKFLSQKKDAHMTKAEVMKNISKFTSRVKTSRLKDDKRKFLPNKQLVKLFGLKAADVKNMTFVEINKHVSQHLTKL